MAHRNDGPYSDLELPVRELFDLPGGIAWLNSAYLGARAKPVAEAMAAAVNRPLSEVTVPDFFVPGDRLRALFSAMVGGDAEGVALVPSASYGVATAAAALGVGEGDRVLMLEEQFPAMVYPWTEREAEPVFIKRPSDDDWTRAVLDRLDETVSVVSAPACHWTDGTRLDLETIGAAARSVGARLVLDVSQSMGMQPFDVKVVRPDFVVSVGYKWLLGPPGMSYLWASPENRDGRPLDANWMARAGSEDFLQGERVPLGVGFRSAALRRRADLEPVADRGGGPSPGNRERRGSPPVGRPRANPHRPPSHRSSRPGPCGAPPQIPQFPPDGFEIARRRRPAVAGDGTRLPVGARLGEGRLGEGVGSHVEHAGRCGPSVGRLIRLVNLT